MNSIHQSQLVKLISANLENNLKSLRENFKNSIDDVGVRYCFIDDLLPIEIASKIADSFPHFQEMRHIQSFRENKYTSKNFDKFNPILKDMTFSIQDEIVISLVTEITGIREQIADPTLYAGGLSMMPKGSFLNPHIDNSHDMGRKNYRTLNLLYYASKDWKEEYGGNLELWDKQVKQKVTIHSKFNRLVLMETNPWSWHSVSKVKVNLSRNCVSNYYFSLKSPIVREYFNVTSYSARPEDWSMSMLYKTDNIIRSGIRLIFPNGLGKKDTYSAGKNV